MLRKSMLMTAAGLLLAAAFALSSPAARARNLAEATQVPMPANGTATPDQASSERSDANGATVKIVSPSNGATVHDSSVMVKVETTGLALGSDGVHFHLYVDGKQQGMSEGNNNALVARDLTPGEHTLEVVLANGQHQELNASAMIKINAQPASTTPVSSTTDFSVVLIAGLVVVIVVIGGAGFAISRRK